MRRNPRSLLSLAAVSLVATLGLTACGGGGTNASNPLDTAGATEPAAAGSVVIGSANFTESEILAQIYAEALTANGVKATTKLNIGTRESYIKALEGGEISVVPEYTGNLLAFLDSAATAKTADEVNAALPAALDAKGLKMYTPSAAADSDTVTVTKATADKWQLKTIGDLAAHNAEVTFGAPPEFQTRSVGLPALKEAYGLEPATFTPISDGGGPSTVKALVDGDITAANIFSTSQDIKANNLVVLEDDKQAFLANNVVPIVSNSVTDAKVETVLNAVSAKLTTEQLADLNNDVSGEARMEPAEAAKAWVEENGLNQVG
ncbi:ABC transporter substrate-binding protein [Micrococcales bacterium 31B]|nr:ABC transporter substrate-binding protein [Micrococcales bacterium 31B]